VGGEPRYREGRFAGPHGGRMDEEHGQRYYSRIAFLSIMGPWIESYDAP
jgi:hypothetical protein